MSRTRSYTAAVALLALYCLISLLLEVPNLARGAAPVEGEPPFALTIINFTTAILGLVAAYGAWRMQKWGVLLVIVVAAIGVLTSLPALLIPSLPLRLLGALGAAWSAAIIVLILRPLPHPASA